MQTEDPRYFIQGCQKIKTVLADTISQLSEGPSLDKPEKERLQRLASDLNGVLESLPDPERWNQLLADVANEAKIQAHTPGRRGNGEQW